MKTTLSKILATALLVLPFGVALPAVAAVPQWDTTGSYVLAIKYLGTDYMHDMVLAQDGAGNLTGHGGSPAGANTYTWVITSGTVSGAAIDFTAHYTASADAVTPLTTMHVMGTIASNGTLSGTWSDNYQGGARSGTWTSTAGAATPIGSLAAEDFGVVNYDTGLGILKGYSAGFGLTNATFAGAQSVVVQLFAGASLLQTNTATAKVGTDITGAQISSPFDVSGNFSYATDGYWTNVRQSQFGQSATATRVVATVTLANGKVVTAENTNLSGNASTIFPPTTTPPVGTSTPPTKSSQCKNNGWTTFTNPSFKNQGQCVKYVQHHKVHRDKDEEKNEHEDKDTHGKNHNDTDTAGHVNTKHGNK